MNSDDKKKIKKHLPRLVEDIDPLQIMTYLPCLTKYYRESITNAQHSFQGNRSLAVHKLLDILYTRPTGFRELVEALRNPEVDKDDIANRLDPPDASTVHSPVDRRITNSEMSVSPWRTTTTTTVTARQSRKDSKTPVTMETPYKLLPVSVVNKLKRMDGCQIKNADKLAEVIGLTLQDVNTISAQCRGSLTLAYLQNWDENEDITLQDLLHALYRMERIDLIQEFENSLNVSFEPEVEDAGNNRGARNDAGNDREARNDAGGPSRSQANVVSNESHHYVQPSNIGSVRQQPTAGEGFNQACNRIPPPPDLSHQRPTISGEAVKTTHPETTVGSHGFHVRQIPSYSNGQPVLELRNANGLANVPKEFMHELQPSNKMFETVSPSSGKYSDKTCQDGSFEPDRKNHPIAEKQTKFNGYLPAELLNNNQSHLDGYVEEEKGDSMKDKAGNVFSGYKEEEIRLGGGAYGHEMRASDPPQTILNNQLSSPKPLEHRCSKRFEFSENHHDLTTNARPELVHQIDDDVRNIETTQDGINDLDHVCSSNSDNSLYGSMPDNNEELNVAGDKKVENIGSVCEGAELGHKSTTELNNQDNFTADKTYHAMALMAEAQNVTDSSVRFDSGKSLRLSESVGVGNTEEQRRRLEHALLQDNIENIHAHVMGSEDSTSRNISIADSMTSYSYESQNDDTVVPKLSIQSELNSIMRKANKPLPGEDEGEDDLTSYDNDIDEQLSVDGMSPGIVDGRIQLGMSRDVGMYPQSEPFMGAQGTVTWAQGCSPRTQGTSYETQGTSPMAQGTSPRTQGTSPGTLETSYGTQGTSPMAQGTSPRTQGTSPGTLETSYGTQGTSPRAQGTSPVTPYVIQQPPKLTDLDVPHHENACAVNKNFIIGNEHDNLSVTQLESSRNDITFQQDRSQYGQYSVHELPRSLDLGVTSGHNTVHGDNVARVVAEQQTVMVEKVSEEAKSDDSGQSVDNGRWNDVFTSSLRLAFNVFKTTNDSLL